MNIPQPSQEPHWSRDLYEAIHLIESVYGRLSPRLTQARRTLLQSQENLASPETLARMLALDSILRNRMARSLEQAKLCIWHANTLVGVIRQVLTATRVPGEVAIFEQIRSIAQYHGPFQVRAMRITNGLATLSLIMQEEEPLGNLHLQPTLRDLLSDGVLYLDHAHEITVQVEQYLHERGQ